MTGGQEGQSLLSTYVHMPMNVKKLHRASGVMRHKSLSIY
jgi:hypothetical protein